MSTYDPTDLRGQERERELRDTRQRAEREVEEGDIRWLMNFKEGRRIVWRLLDVAGVNRISFHTNALQMAFNEGNRNYGNMLLAQINQLCPRQYTLMLKEHRESQKEKNGDGSGRNQN